jgi:hypothetical protein
MCTVTIIHGHRVRGSAEISKDCRRRVKAAERYTSVSWVIFSGFGLDNNPSEAMQMSFAWRGPSHLRYLESESRHTYENVQLAGKIAVGMKADKIHVVTNWWNAPRCWLVWKIWKEHTESKPTVRIHACSGSVGYLFQELKSWKRYIHHA